MKNDQVAAALESLAANVASAPRRTIGYSSRVYVGPGASAGTVIGHQSIAVAGPGGGTVIGTNVSVGVGGPDPAAALVQELRDAAAAARQDKGNKAWFTSILSRVSALTDRVVDAGLIAVAEEAIKSAF